jgi:hypothetical protein
VVKAGVLLLLVDKKGELLLLELSNGDELLLELSNGDELLLDDDIIDHHISIPPDIVRRKQSYISSMVTITTSLLR